jgi:enterochelin esterase-like enzyme
MKRLFALVLLVVVAPAFAQQQLVSPEVHPDGRVTFRLRAPNAKAVTLRLEATKTPAMQKDDQGVWSVTTEPLPPDFYVYSFNVDGVQMIDPSNPLLKYNLFNTESQVHVPGKDLPWDVADVPHGVLHRHLYRSTIVGMDCPFVVYTPPAYDPNVKQPYPALYLLHGFSDAEDAWTSIGQANIILDNLIAQGKAKPMLIVMPLGYGNKQLMTGGWAGVRQGNAWPDSIEKFRDVLLKEVMPQVEKAYRVSTDRTGRAITGLSMGGTESLLIGFNVLDRFAWIGAFSSGGLDANFDKNYPAVNESTSSQLRLLWIGCGQQDSLVAINQKLVDWLKTKKINPTWVTIPGGHSFMVWRRFLAQFAPLLFQDRPRADSVDNRSSHSDVLNSYQSGADAFKNDWLSGYLRAKASTEEGRYFPRGVLDSSRTESLSHWFSEQLIAMGEQPIWNGREPSELVYRFLLLPTFGRPVAVHVQRSGSLVYLRAVELDGAGGYGPGRIAREIQRELTPAELEMLQTRLDKAGFWRMQAEDDSIGFDGTEWILEANQAGKYHVVDRSTTGGDFYDACLYFLQLSGLTVSANEIH